MQLMLLLLLSFSFLEKKAVTIKKKKSNQNIFQLPTHTLRHAQYKHYNWVSVAYQISHAETYQSGEKEICSQLLARFCLYMINMHLLKINGIPNTIVSNHVNFDHVPSFSCHDVWNVRQTTSSVYTITTNHSRRCGRL